MLYSVSHPLLFLQGLGVLDAKPESLLVRQFERHAQAQPERTFLRFEDAQFSYGEANALANQYAHAYRGLGIGRGDVVALLLDNRPEFLWHLLGLHKLGAISSLINTYLIGDSLAHAVHICQPRHVVVGSALWPAFRNIRERLSELPDTAIDVDVDPQTRQAPSAPLWNDRLLHAARTNPMLKEAVHPNDQAAYIYTSGTTGLPKAAVVRHSRFFRAAADMRS